MHPSKPPFFTDALPHTVRSKNKYHSYQSPKVLFLNQCGKLAVLILLLLVGTPDAHSQPARPSATPMSAGERAFISKLLSAGSSEQRTALLELNKQYITENFFRRVTEAAILYCDKSEYEISEKLVDAGKRIAERLGDIDVIIESLRCAGELQMKRGEPSKAIETFLRGAELLEKSRSKRVALPLLRNLALAHRDRADFRTAVEYAGRLKTLADELNDRAGMSWAHFILGNIHFIRTEYDDALEEFSKSKELLPPGPENDTLKFELITHLAAIPLYRGNYKESRANASKFVIS